MRPGGRVHKPPKTFGIRVLYSAIPPTEFIPIPTRVNGSGLKEKFTNVKLIYNALQKNVAMHKKSCYIPIIEN